MARLSERTFVCPDPRCMGDVKYGKHPNGDGRRAMAWYCQGCEVVYGDRPFKPPYTPLPLMEKSDTTPQGEKEE